ncbi:MAG: ABC transporter substrate-binding protein [Actinomycetota bacterium]
MATAIDRRSFLARSAATAGGVVTAGTLADLAMAETAGATTYTGVLRVGLLDLPTAGVGPAWGKMDSAGFSIMRAVYDPLFVIDKNGVAKGFLAESGVPSNGNKSWTIKLRAGITFHDGSPLNADALIANMNAWIHPSAIAHYAVAPLIQPPHSSTANTVKIDNLTVKLTLNYPWVSFLNTLAEQQIAYIQAVSSINANKAHAGNGDKAPVGTGPFVFNSCDWNVSSVFYADHNPDYWIAGLPNVAKIAFHPIVNGVARVAALGTGPTDMDIVVVSEANAIKAFKNNPGAANSDLSHYVDDSSAAGYAIRTPAVNSIQFNCRTALGYKKSPFSNYIGATKKINGVLQPLYTGAGFLARRAVVQAIDRHAVNATIGLGVTPNADQVFPPTSVYGKSKTAFPGYSKTKAIADAKKAKFTAFTLMSTSDSSAVASANAIQGYCAAAGIAVTIAYLDASTLINAALVGNYDATLWNQFGGVNPDVNFPWFNTLDGANGALVSINMAGNFDPVIETAMLAAMGAGAPKTQLSKWNAVMSQINKDIPYCWMSYQVSAIISHTHCNGWQNPTVTPTGGSAIQLLNHEGTTAWWSTATLS